MISGVGTNASEPEWEARFASLNRWIAAKPNSVTPRIALSSAYVDYAWKARGSGYANEVTPEGWKLFGERLQRARELLDQTTGLKTKDPQYYLLMVRIARGQDWERTDSEQLLTQAIAQEPGYYYVYDEYAISLMRHWGGGEGQATRFAGAIADRIGGAEGDIVYFHIAHTFAAFDFDYLDALSWPRIQRGFQSMETEYGSSPMKLNWFCQMASFMDKQADAASLFERIGENWDKDTWGERFNFDEQRQIAQSMRNLDATAMPSPARQFNEATADLFRQRYSRIVSDCVKGVERVPQSFNVYIQIKSDGGIMNAELLNDQSLIYCLDLKLFHSQFPLPPQESLIEPDKTFTWVRSAITQPQTTDYE